MPVSRRKRQQRKRGPVSSRKRKTGPHNKASAVAKERSFHQHSVLRFLFIFGALLALFYVFVAFSRSYNNRFLPSYHDWLAKASGDLLAVLGQDITVTGPSIRSPGFSASIIRGCDAVEAIALFVFAVLAFPLSFSKKLKGVIAGVLLLSALNLVRIVSLFLIGVYSRRVFALMHLDVWQALFIFFAVLLWILWLLWATRSQVVAQTVPG